MPVIIPSPEQWFRTQQRDLYVIEYQEKPDFFEDSDESLLIQDEQMLKDWFKTHLPHIPLSIIGHSEYSGWIDGGF